jgi:hypothetical protein
MSNPTNYYIWRFTPVAKPEDPAWQGRRIWADFQIVAATAGEAVLLASQQDELLGGRSVRDSQDLQQLRSGFEDSVLYRVDRMDVVAPSEQPPGTVVSKELRSLLPH